MKPHCPPRPAGRLQGGFTLLEALIALLIVSFGMLAVAGFQVTLSLSTDVAKQRSEALRLAQQKVEELRSFERTVGDGAGGLFDYADDVVSNASPYEAVTGYTTNTSFIRQWTVTGAPTAPQKWVNVAVRWTDRFGITQNVTLVTVISKSDPNDIGTLATGPGSTQTRTPKNRNINIPYPAVQLANDQSGFQPPGGDRFFVFNDTTGDILGYCTDTGLLTEGAVIDLSSSPPASCTSQAAYLLSGYVRFWDDQNGTVTAGEVENISGTRGETGNLTATIAFTDRSPALGNADVQCYTQRQVTAFNTSTGAVIVIAADTTPPSGYTVPADASKFVAYACVIVPIDDAVVPSNPRNVWSGQLLVTPASPTGTAVTWALDSSTAASGSTVTTLGTHKVCRYTGDYIIDNVLSNSEHPLYYRGVTGALDNQNYVVIKRAETCPRDQAVNPLAGDYINSNTTRHQLHGATALALDTATYGSSFGGLRTGTNTPGSNPNDDGGFTIQESTDSAAYLPMFETGN